MEMRTMDEGDWHRTFNQLGGAIDPAVALAGLFEKPKSPGHLLEMLSFTDANVSGHSASGKTYWATFKQLSRLLPCFPFDDKGNVTATVESYDYLTEHYALIQSMLWACPKWKVWPFEVDAPFPRRHICTGQYRRLMLRGNESQIAAGGYWAVLIKGE